MTATGWVWYTHTMRNYIRLGCAALVLALGMSVRAEEYQQLKTKAEILVGYVQELYDEACRKGSETHSPLYQYYFKLMNDTGKDLLSRPESVTNKQRLQKYFELAEKDYEAYTKLSGDADKAAAIGNDRVYVGRNHVVTNGSRRRAKRLVNIERLGEKELALAIERWEKFSAQVKRDTAAK